MKDWWKAPVLQGEDNDYGDYDYLINPLPENKTYLSNWGYKCESCGKYHKYNFVTDQYFYTLDGYDSLSYQECIPCAVKSKIYSYKRRIRQHLEAKRWHFFAYNKLGKKIENWVFKLFNKFPDNPIVKKLFIYTIPF